jgi:hypothetical protein
MNDFLKIIGEKYPDLERYLQGLKKSSASDYREYETAKNFLRKFPLSEIEYEDCIKYIGERLDI